MDTFPTDSSHKHVPCAASQADIVIVNWNSGRYLADCLETLGGLSHEQIGSVHVVDNASSDNSLSCLNDIALPLTAIRNHTNKGFARACNQGASSGTAPFILFLNPDTRLYENSLAHPLEYMAREGNGHIGICGIQMLDENDNVIRSCAYFPSFFRLMAQTTGLANVPGFRSLSMQMTDWPHKDTRVVDQVIGAFFLVRRSLFEQLGGFDERFFVYFEEVDFSLRAQQVDIFSIYLDSAQAFHVGGGSSRQVKGTRLFYFLQSRLLYSFKHLPSWQAWILLCLTLFIEPWSRIFYSAARGSWNDIRNTLVGYRMLLVALPGLLRKRHGVR